MSSVPNIPPITRLINPPNTNVKLCLIGLILSIDHKMYNREKSKKDRTFCNIYPKDIFPTFSACSLKTSLFCCLSAESKSENLGKCSSVSGWAWNILKWIKYSDIFNLAQIVVSYCTKSLTPVTCSSRLIPFQEPFSRNLKYVLNSIIARRKGRA